MRAYDELADPIFRYCYFRLYDRDRAREFMQETFLRAWERLSRGDDIRELRPYLYRIAFHLIVDESAKRKTVSLEALEEVGKEPGRDDRDRRERAVDLALIRRIVDRLDPEDREVIVMRYINGLSPKEIAEALEVSANVVSVRIHRAVKKVKNLLSI